MKMKNIEDIYPLSPMQEGMLFHILYAPGTGIYFEQIVLSIQGHLNVPAFKQAWELVIERHSAFRTLYVWEGREKPLQVVLRQVDLPWEEQNWEGEVSGDGEEGLGAFLRDDRHRGLELSKAPGMRLSLIHRREESYYFVLSCSHLILDRWSISIVLKEVFSQYTAICQHTEIQLEEPRPYLDYISWLRKKDRAQAEAFWKECLGEFTNPTTLRLDRAHEEFSDQVIEYGELRKEISRSIVERLEGFARAHRLTMNTIVQGAWAVLLSRYSSQEDIVFGATLAGRPVDLSGAESMVGLFINTLPIRVQVSPGEIMLPWLQRLQDRMVEIRQYEFSSLVEVQGWSDVPKGVPLFNSILVYENISLFDPSQELGPGLDVRVLRSGGGGTNYPLVVVVLPEPEMVIRMHYQSHRFDERSVKRVLTHFETLLHEIVENPQQPIGALSPLTDAERRQILESWNDTSVPYPNENCIHQLFEAQVGRSPDAVGLVFRGQRLTYRQLNSRANQLARYLRRKGIEPEVPVGVFLERSIEMVISLLAVHKAGGVFVPLDPAFPRERLAFLLEDSRAGALLTHTSLLEKLSPCKAEVIDLDADWDIIAEEQEGDLNLSLFSQNLAYVIYTSGSTGAPKGVMVSHDSLCNYLYWMQDVYPIDAEDKVLQKTPFSFDASIWEFYGPLIVGAQVVMARPEGHMDAAYLIETIQTEGISVLKTTPAQLKMLLDQEHFKSLTTLRRLLCGGDVMPPEFPKRVFDALDVEFNHTYGPTEACVNAATWKFDPGDDSRRIPIGHPISNVRLFILDSSLEPAPIGVPGELYIAGVGLARGYWMQPVLTAESFIPNPYPISAGERIYRTGDLARWFKDGSIEFIGRVDHQVKLRGYRIELGEIESVLGNHEDITQVVVLLREDEPGEERLVAYIVASGGTRLEVAYLRAYLKKVLPEYMIPSAFVILDQMPLNSSGKVDRKALPLPGRTRPENESLIPPSSETEEILVDIWKDVLNLERVGVNDNFFELGGHSLLVMRVINRARDVFGADIPIRWLFESPTIAEFAAHIEQLLLLSRKPQITSSEISGTYEAD